MGAWQVGCFVSVESFLSIFGFAIGKLVFFHKHDQELAVNLIVIDKKNVQSAVGY